MQSMLILQESRSWGGLGAGGGWGVSWGRALTGRGPAPRPLLPRLWWVHRRTRGVLVPSPGTGECVALFGIKVFADGVK